MRSFTIFLFFTLFIIAMDLYAYRGINHLAGIPSKANSVFTLVFWGVSVVMLVMLVWAGKQFQKMRDPSSFVGVMVVMGIFLMLYVPKLFFNSCQLLGDLSQFAVGIFHDGSLPIRKWFLSFGAVLGSLLFLGFGMGMLRGRTNVKVFREEVKIANLPQAFNGLKIVQLSDLHLAGFYNQPNHVRQVVEMVNSLEPELILFTGDMVHNFSEELDPFTEILNGLDAPLGKFAVLGNHDYGHYFQWDSERDEGANLDRVKDQIRVAGFDLLLNEHRTIAINGSSMEIIGVENWGKPPFPQKGDLAKALEGTSMDHVKVLMSHDPSHWEAQVKDKTPVALTLSGHTHGMQFGFEIGRFRWSPSRWTYRHWAGLYGENGQYLYVNRGLGFTGFPGRVGIRPEITLLTLTGARPSAH